MKYLFLLLLLIPIVHSAEIELMPGECYNITDIDNTSNRFCAVPELNYTYNITRIKELSLVIDVDNCMIRDGNQTLQSISKNVDTAKKFFNLSFICPSPIPANESLANVSQMCSDAAVWDLLTTQLVINEGLLDSALHESAKFDQYRVLYTNCQTEMNYSTELKIACDKKLGSCEQQVEDHLGAQYVFFMLILMSMIFGTYGIYKYMLANRKGGQFIKT